jgi:hypothetical protein
MATISKDLTDRILDTMHKNSQNSTKTEKKKTSDIRISNKDRQKIGFRTNVKDHETKRIGTIQKE